MARRGKAWDDYFCGNALHLLGTEAVRREWKQWRGRETHNEEFRWDYSSFPEGAVQLDYANPGWIPLTQDAGANYLGVDLAPGPNGSIGQVISFGRDERQKCALAKSWSGFLGDIATSLESGAVPVHDPDPTIWGEVWDEVFGSHCHDGIRERLRAGTWPLRK